MRRIGFALVMSAFLSGASSFVIAERGSAESTAAEAKDADNTGRNERDRDDRTLTPMDQGTSDSDIAITRAVRQDVTDNDAFSTNAKNVKIITRDGVVTLRGPVETADEKAQIGALAARPEGVRSVDNQIEIETND